jgi:hypothetical protein
MEQLLKDAITILKQAQESSITILKSDEKLSTTVIMVEHGMNTLLNRLKFQLGEGLVIPGTVQFPPLNKVDGQSFIKEDPVEASTPVKEEVDILKQKVADFEQNLPELTNDVILKSYKNKADKLIIRGLAKKAGVPEYETAKIDELFLNAIRDGLSNGKEVVKLDKAAILAQIATANTPEAIRSLVSQSQDEEVQQAGLDRVIELEGGKEE